MESIGSITKRKDGRNRTKRTSEVVVVVEEMIQNEPKTAKTFLRHLALQVNTSEESAAQYLKWIYIYILTA